MGWCTRSRKARRSSRPRARRRRRSRARTRRRTDAGILGTLTGQCSMVRLSAMKTPLILSMVLALFPVSMGCQSSGHQQADTTATHMDELRADAEAAKASVHAAATSLASVVEKAELDPKPAYAQFE